MNHKVACCVHLNTACFSHVTIDNKNHRTSGAGFCCQCVIPQGPHTDIVFIIFCLTLAEVLVFNWWEKEKNYKLCLFKGDFIL